MISLYVEPKKCNRLVSTTIITTTTKADSQIENKLVVTSGERERGTIWGQRNKKLRRTNKLKIKVKIR